MKKITILLIALLLSNTFIFSQPANYSGWFFLNPLPTPMGLFSVRFIDSHTGFAVGDHNNLLKTTNGGTNWYLNYELVSIENNRSFVNNRLSSISSTNSNDIYVAGILGYQDKSALRTMDCGDNWSYMQQNIGGKSVFFTSPDTGYIAGMGYIYKTTNAGYNWTTSYYGNHGLESIDFVDSKTGYAVGMATGAIGVILKTTNGGINWAKDTIGNNSFNCVQFITIDTGFICGTNRIYKTINAGLKWDTVRTGYWEQFQTMYFLNSKTGYAGNYNWPAKLYKTTNGGTNWQICLERESGFTGIYFTDYDTGYVTAGEVLKTTNAGATWVSQQSDFTAKKSFFQTLEFLDQNTGFAGDDMGQIFKTSDAGNNWSKVRDTSGIEYPPRVEDIHFVNNQTGYAVGDERMILKTTNGGLNWLHQRAEVTSNYIYYALYFSDALTGFIAGTEWNHGIINKRASKSSLYSLGQGHIILKTTNGGANWYVKDSTSDVNTNLYSIGFKDANTGYAAGDPKIYRTTNGGENWNISSDLTNECYSCQFCKILFVNPSTGFITGFPNNTGTGALYKTTNGGTTWARYNMNVDGLYTIDFADQNTGYACGLSGTLIKTTNCGVNWYTLYSGVGIDIADISFTGPNTGYAVGLGGLVLKTTTGGGSPIGISPVSNSVPEKYYLQQNYPNPFNPTTKIRFSIPTPLSFGDAWRTSGALGVRLVIYDILGREVAELLNESLKPGEYEVEWDGSMYASGVYFYQLVSGDPSTGSGHSFVQTRKMVLMK